MRLTNKQAIVTGGAGGIGRAIVKLFLQEGAHVYVLDRNEQQLLVLQNELAEVDEALSKRCNPVVCDISDEASLREAFELIEKNMDGIDVVVNNAGIATRERFVDIPLDRWDRIMDINVRGMFLLSQWAAKTMIRQGRGGAIVNMSSKNGLAGSTYLAHYNASKGAVELLTRSMAAELAEHGIRVNAVAPGFIDTSINDGLTADGQDPLNLAQLARRTPMKRLGTADEVAQAFLFLASDAASFVTGTTLVVDGGHLANASDF